MKIDGVFKFYVIPFYVKFVEPLYFYDNFLIPLYYIGTFLCTINVFEYIVIP